MRTTDLALWQGDLVQLADEVVVRPGADSDLAAIEAIAKATGQEEDWTGVFPLYIRHLMTQGRFLVAEREGVVAGYGATRSIGAGPGAVSVLADLFVDPGIHSAGIGRRILGELWRDERRKMTFSSLHPNALPLYTSFGVDAWWPLLYLRGDVRTLPMPKGWSVADAEPDQVARLEQEWTGVDREADHRMWATWPMHRGVVASVRGRPIAAGSTGGADAEYGIIHLAMDVARAADQDACDAVLAVLSCLEAADGKARACLPAPHPATRALLSIGWRIEDRDLHMSSEFGLIDPLRLVPSPALA